jgi:hypothetical protein
MFRLLYLIPLILVGCGKGGLFDQMRIQDSLVSGASDPVGINSIFLSEDTSLGVRRGVLNDLYAVNLVGGEYLPIIKTQAGVFYLSPWGGFEYKNNQKVKSRIGGIFIRNTDSKIYPWYIHEGFDEQEWVAWKEGRRTSMVVPGMLGLAFRPYTELDLEVPTDLIN